MKFYIYSFKNISTVAKNLCLDNFRYLWEGILKHSWGKKRKNIEIFSADVSKFISFWILYDGVN